jgi:hypothetical protein
MAEAYGVDCGKCKQVLYTNCEHIGRAYKIFHDKKNDIFTNYCAGCLKTVRKQDDKVYHFHCNEDKCKWRCMKSNQNDRPYWMVYLG